MTKVEDSVSSGTAEPMRGGGHKVFFNIATHTVLPILRLHRSPNV
jgi:hypothetical protein